MKTPAPNDISKIDQSIAIFREYLAPAMKSFYDSFIAAGFDPTQALQLTMFTWTRVMEKDLPQGPKENEL